jgi:hypothetical protein
MADDQDDKAAGYVVQSTDDHFLSRTMRFVRKRDRSKAKGINRAWVHRKVSLLEAGPWASEATMVYPARYNGTTTYAEILGPAITFREFVAAQ